jgi:hypothetical protein
MGGSGGSYSPPRKTSVDCGEITFITVINSSQNLDTLRVGDTIMLEKSSAHELIFVTQTGIQVGKLFSSQLLRIASCIERGYGYSAIIKDISDDVCRVEVFCSKNP